MAAATQAFTPLNSQAAGMFRRSVASRNDFFAPYVKGKHVLDLGCTDTKTDGHVAEAEIGLHRWLITQCASVLGADLDPHGVARMVEAGFNVCCADAEDLQLGRRFDCIVAGEIIEHLSNPGRAVASWRDHLNPDGVLLLTTCNPFYFKQTWKIARRGRPQVHGGHTMWFDPSTLGQLLGRAGLEIISGAWIRPRRRFHPLAFPSLLRPYFSSNLALAARPV